MRSASKKVFAGVAIAAMLFAGCSSNSSSSSGSAGINETELQYSYDPQPYSNLKDGGTLSMSITELNLQANVFQANMTSYTRSIWNWYNPQLIMFSPTGDDMVINPNYLDSLDAEEVDGKTVVTYKINDDAKYNNGEDIDWTAFQATWQANNGQNDAYQVNSTDGYELIESVEQGENAKTAVVTFQGAYPWYGGLFNTLLNPNVNTPDLFNNTYNEGTLESMHTEWGAGPYILTSYDRNTGTAIFERNSNWWGDPGKLDQITFQVREADASINAFKNGETDMTSVNSSDRLAQVQDMQDIEIRRGSAPVTRLITLNSESDVLSDITVRQAIATSLNREQINQVRFQGLDYNATPMGSLAIYPYQEGYEDNYAKVVPEADPEAAMKLLEDDGWAKNSDGIYEKDGQTLNLRLPLFSDNTTMKAVYQIIQTQLKASGINVDIIQKSGGDFAQVIRDRDFDMLFSGFASSDPYGVAYFCQVYCSDSTLNKSKTGTEEMDNKIRTELQTLPTAEEQIAKANELEAEALSTYGVVPVLSDPEIYAAKTGLANVGAGAFATANLGIGSFVENVGWTND